MSRHVAPYGNSHKGAALSDSCKKNKTCLKVPLLNKGNQLTKGGFQMNNIKVRATLLFARRYSFSQQSGENKGELVEGIKIEYYPEDNFLPIEDQEAGTYGNQIMSDTIPYSELSSLKSVPGVYEFGCSMGQAKIRSGNVEKLVPRLKVNTMKFINDFNPSTKP